MALRVAINGFGRIGRIVTKLALGNKDIDVVAINDLTDAATLAHLFMYDSVHGVFPGKVEHTADSLIINGKPIRIYALGNHDELPWKKESIDVVLESTGLLTSRDKCEPHLLAGAGRVVVSAPAEDADITIVMGVNDHLYNPQKHTIISSASCTTNCLAPVAKVLNDSFGIEKGLVTSVHAYTNDQSVLDLPHKDLHRARAAALSMIPTTTGAARTVSRVLPELEGKLDCMAIHVPIPNVSAIDMVATLGKKVDQAQVNAAFEKASKGALKGVLGYSEVLLVSVDYNGYSLSAIVDASSTKVIGDNMVKVIAWYDNETGFSHRVVDLLNLIASKS
jgi:glyceraldehyde 3-phosphate dehydrogenase